MGTGVGGIPTSRGIEGSGGHSRRVAGVVSNLRAGAGERGEGGVCEWAWGGGTNRSDIGLNLSGSWQQGHSATYNTPSRI